jgi:hypothetical protein
VRFDANRQLYRVDPERLASLRAFLDDFWGDHLDTLKTTAETMHGPPAPHPAGHGVKLVDKAIQVNAPAELLYELLTTPSTSSAGWPPSPRSTPAPGARSAGRMPTATPVPDSSSSSSRLRRSG